MSNGLIAVLIILVVIAGSIITRRCTEFLFLGSIVGAIILYGKGTPFAYVELLETVVGAEDSVWLWLACGLFGSLIAVLQAGKGTLGFQRFMRKICTNKRRTLLASFFLSICLCIDEYLQILTVGLCTRKMSDEQKLPRESLAFILDSAGAPAVVLMPFSTWGIFFGKLFFANVAVSTVYASAFDAYVHAIPYCFYSFFALAVVFTFCMGWFPKIGPMKKAFKRVEETGKVYSDESRKYNLDEEDGQQGDGNILDFIIPMVVLILVAVISKEMILGVICALLVCLIQFIPRKLMTVEQFTNNIIEGFGSMLPIFFMLVGAFSLANVTSQLGLTMYLIELAKPIISPSIFPALTFVLLAVLAFVTGSNWGMSAIVIPIMVPMAAAIGASLPLTMAAILSGGAFGSHACFYTDATLLASKSSKIENMEHALTQWPYVFISAGLSTVLFWIFATIGIE